MVTLYSKVVGDGDQHILFIHGWASSGKMWNKIVDILHNDAQLYLIDLPGFGQSRDMKLVPPDLPKYCNALANFLQESEVKFDLIIGHSMGATIVINLLAKGHYPIEKLILISPVISGAYGKNGLVSLLMRQMSKSHRLKQLSYYIWSILLNPTMIRFFLSIFVRNRDLRRYLAKDFDALDKIYAVDSLIQLSYMDVRSVATAITNETLICIGKNDLVVPPSEGRQLSILMPNAELLEFKRSGHYPHDENTPLFIEYIKRFL